MADATDLWRKVFAAFDPRRPLGAGEIDDLYLERPNAPAKRILSEIELGLERRATFVLCGSRGSGKSTELACIEHALSDRWLLVRVDLQDSLPDPPSAGGLLMALAVAIAHAAWRLDRGQPAQRDAEKLLRACLAPLGDKVERELDVSGLVTGVASAVAVTSAEPLTRAIAGTAAAVAGAARLLWSPSASQAALEAGEAKLQRVVDGINALLERLARAGHQGTVILADGLDKLAGITEVVQVLAHPRLLTDVRASLVLTGPINLLHNTEFNALRQHVSPLPLYNLAVRAPADPDRRAGPGVAALEEVTRRRLAHHDLSRALLPRGVVRELARFSGGSLRDFAELVRGAARSAHDGGRLTITPGDARHAVRDLRHLLQFPLTDRSVEQLNRVLASGRPTGDDHCEELLFNNYILCYPDGDLWYRPHETLVAWLRARPENGDGGGR